MINWQVLGQLIATATIMLSGPAVIVLLAIKKGNHYIFNFDHQYKIFKKILMITALTALLVLISLGLVVTVPVALATPGEWESSKGNFTKGIQACSSYSYSLLLTVLQHHLII
jgi:photosystem II core protein PsbZ